MAEAEHEIDLSGLKCPLPVLRTKRALSGLEPGATLAVITTDPGSAEDIPAFAKLARVELVSMEATEGGHLFVLRK